MRKLAIVSDTVKMSKLVSEHPLIHFGIDHHEDNSSHHHQDRGEHGVQQLMIRSRVTLFHQTLGYFHLLRYQETMYSIVDPTVILLCKIIYS